CEVNVSPVPDDELQVSLGAAFMDENDGIQVAGTGVGAKACKFARIKKAKPFVSLYQRIEIGEPWMDFAKENVSWHAADTFCQQCAAGAGKRVDYCNLRFHSTCCK